LGNFVAYAASITVSPPKIELEMEKGTAVSQAITITNGESTDLILATSAANFTASGEEGQAAFTEGETQTAFSLSSWITLPTGNITVPSQGKIEMPFTVRVPANAEAGGHFGTIFFSPVTAAGGDIAVKQKVGVLLLVKVKGEIKEQGALDIFDTYSTEVKGDDIAKAASRTFFESFPINLAVRLTNSGNVHSKPTGKITLKNTFGAVLERVGEEAVLSPTGAVTGTKLVDYLPVNDRNGNVLPSSSRVFLQTWKGYGTVTYDGLGKKEIIWKGLGFGRYTAELELNYAGTDLQKQVIHFWILPWKIISGAVIGLIALFFIIKKWRQMSRERIKRQLRKELERERD
ncbi:MAG: hypothetical protein Q8L21_01550, partial [Candidatus Komeilibacteria bacterium]|nr:hypothetical protein [Candidatus Komeilibacteria bacterium]